MRAEDWQKMLGEINSLNPEYIIEEIKNRLEKVLDQGEYKKWEDEGFNPNYLFQFQYENISDQLATLLHISACLNLGNIVNALLAAGASVNAVDGSGITPLHCAVDAGIVKALLAAKANVNAVDVYRQTPLHDVVNEDVVNVLLENGANVNARDKDGKTPLHYAAYRGYVAIVNALLKKGADVNVRDEGGKIPLYYATNKGYVDVVGVLLAKKADVDARDGDEKTPFNPTKICVSVVCLTVACEVGIAAFFIVKGNVAVEPKHMILIVVAIAVVALAVGCIVHQALKPSTKVDKTQTFVGYNQEIYVRDP